MVKPALNLPIVTSEKFCDEVDANSSMMSYMDAMLKACDKFEIEIEMVSQLITPKLKKLLQAEAMNANLLKRKGGSRLPI